MSVRLSQLAVIATSLLVLLCFIYSNELLLQTGISPKGEENIEEHSNRVRTGPIPTNEPILVAKLQGIRWGGQLGNQVYEILSFISIARTLERKPIIVLGDEFNHVSTPALWNLVTHFPRILKGIPVYHNTSFYKAAWSIMEMGDCAVCFEDVVSMHIPYKNEQTLILHGQYLQSHHYLESIPREEILDRLRFPFESQNFLRDIVSEKAFLTKKRLCVHTRRKDFVTNGHQFTDENFMFKAIQNITNSDKNAYSVVLFGDDERFLRNFTASKRYAPWNKLTFLPYNGWGKFQMPAHFVWLFFKYHCETILLTAPTSTFGFWGAWLAEKADVFYCPIKDSKLILPTDWQQLILK